MAFVDKTLTCRDCGVSFVFTVGEQEFYAGRGFAHEPTRCPACRAERKAGPGGGSASAPPRKRPREMHAALCASCGAETTVPFLPRGDRPVYCPACFEKMRRD